MGVFPRDGGEALLRNLCGIMQCESAAAASGSTSVGRYSRHRTLHHDRSTGESQRRFAKQLDETLPRPEIEGSWVRVENGKTQYMALPIAGDGFCKAHYPRAKTSSLINLAEQQQSDESDAGLGIVPDHLQTSDGLGVANDFVDELVRGVLAGRQCVEEVNGGVWRGRLAFDYQAISRRPFEHGLQTLNVVRLAAVDRA